MVSTLLPPARSSSACAARWVPQSNGCNDLPPNGDRTSRMPDLDLITTSGSRRVYTLLHNARPVLLNFGEPGCFDITPWADRVQSVNAQYVGVWELPVLGLVTAPPAVLIRPDGYVAWVGDLTQLGLADVLTTWFGRGSTLEKKE